MASARTRPVHNGRLSPDDIRGYGFGRKINGLDPDDVREFQHLAAEEVATLRREVHNAHRFPAAEVASREATRIMVHAQATGESVLRSAQERARQVVAEAHDHREEIVAGAARQADAIVAEAATRFPADTQAQAAYLDSFSELMISQLRSVIEVLDRRRPGGPGAAG